MTGLLAFGCGGTPPSTFVATSSPPSPSRSPSRAADWIEAVETLVADHERFHPNPYHGIDEATYRRAADDLIGRLPSLNEDQALAELVRLAAMPSWQGRDGHSGIFAFTPDTGTHVYPLRFWQFTDGLVITAARTPYEDLVGSRVTAIDGVRIDEVLDRIEPLSPRDNASNLLAYGPLYMRVSELLSGVNVIEAAGPATFSLLDRGGVPHDERIEPIPVALDLAWNSGMPHRLPPRDALWLEHQDETIWWTVLEDSGTMYVQFNEVRGTGATGQEILQRVADGDVNRVVVDLRQNGGGDNTTYGPLLSALRDPAIDRPGRFFVLIGRITFSAAGNFATELEKSTGAVFAGEDMGSSPNLFGDADPSALPSVGLTLHTATRYHQVSTPDDPRITIEPDISIPLSSEDYFADHDPVLSAVIEAPVPPD